MRFVEVSYHDEVKGYKKTKLFELLKEFQNAHIACAKIEGGSYKNISSQTAALAASIKRFKMSEIKAITKNNNTYLINEIVLDKEER